MWSEKGGGSWLGVYSQKNMESVLFMWSEKGGGSWLGSIQRKIWKVFTKNMERHHMYTKRTTKT